MSINIVVYNKLSAIEGAIYICMYVQISTAHWLQESHAVLLSCQALNHCYITRSKLEAKPLRKSKNLITPLEAPRNEQENRQTLHKYVDHDAKPKRQ